MIRRSGGEDDPKGFRGNPKPSVDPHSQNLRALREREVIGETARERSDEKVRRLSPETRADQCRG